MGAGSSVNSRASSRDSQIRATTTNRSNQRSSVITTHQTNTATDRRRGDTATITSTRVEDDMNRTSLYSNSSHGNVSGTSSNDENSQLIPINDNGYHTNSQTLQMATGSDRRSDPANNVERVTTTPHTHSQEGERVEERDNQRRSTSEQSSLLQETPQPPLHSNTSSLLQRRHGDISIAHNSSHVIVPTTTEHVNIIKTSLELLAREFSVYFNIDNMVPSAIVFTTEPLSVIVDVSSDPMGLYIVYDGEYSYSNSNGGIVLGELYQGDMFGEVACLMNVKNTMCVRCEEREGVLIRIPFNTINNNISGRVLATKTRAWCVRRAHIFTSGLFDPNTLTLLITTSAIKSTKQFNEWSYESLEYLARLCQMTLFNKDDVIYKINDQSSSHLYIIITGRLKIIHKKKESSDIVIIKDTTNSCCIGVKEFFQKIKRKETVIALSPLLAIPLGREALLACVEEFTAEKEHLQSLLSLYAK